MIKYIAIGSDENRALPWPSLSGSQKQIVWAEQIRSNVIKLLEYQIKKLEHELTHLIKTNGGQPGEFSNKRRLWSSINFDYDHLKFIKDSDFFIENLKDFTNINEGFNSELANKCSLRISSSLPSVPYEYKASRKFEQC